MKTNEAVFFVGDFETTTGENYKKEGRVRVLLAGYENIHGKRSETFRSAEQMIEDLQRYVHTEERAKVAIVYFHNLKFDSTFIRVALDKMGGQSVDSETFYKLQKLARKQHRKGVYTITPEKVRRQRLGNDEDNQVINAYNYTTLASELGAVYSLKFVTKFGEIIEFRDSLKLFPSSIEALGYTVGENKKVGYWDYNAYRGRDWEPSAEELDYFWSDIDILQKVMLRFLSEKEELKLTRSSYAYESLKEITAKVLKDKDSSIGNLSNYFYKAKEQEIFDKVFPPSSVVQRTILQPAYAGGITKVTRSRNHINERGEWSDVEELREYLDIKVPGLYLDVNSLYPYVLEQRDYPFGSGRYGKGMYEEDEENPLFIQRFHAKFKIKPETKDETHIAFLPMSWSRTGEEILSDKDLKASAKVLTLSSIDLVWFFYHYDVTEFTPVDFVKYPVVRKPFREFVQTFSEIKVDANKKMKQAKAEGNDQEARKWAEIRQEAKLTLNGSYGKFGEKALKKKIKIDVVDGVNKNVNTGWEYSDTKYLPVAIFTTAYARDVLLKAVQTVGQRFLYCDTDSVHIVGTSLPEGLPVDDSKLGFWKVEEEFTEARYIGAKRYGEHLKNGKHDIKCAGLDKGARAGIKTIWQLKNYREGQREVKKIERKAFTFKDHPKVCGFVITYGTPGEYTGQTYAKQVKGGTLLYEDSKKLSEPAHVIRPNELTPEEVQALKSYEKSLKKAVEEFDNLKELPRNPLPEHSYLQGTFSRFFGYFEVINDLLKYNNKDKEEYKNDFAETVESFARLLYNL